MSPSAPCTLGAAEPDDADHRWQATLDAFPDSVAILAPDGSVLATNEAWHDLGTTDDGVALAVVGSHYVDVCRGRGPGAATVEHAIGRVLAGADRVVARDWPQTGPVSSSPSGVTVSAIGVGRAAAMVVLHRGRRRDPTGLDRPSAGSLGRLRAVGSAVPAARAQHPGEGATRTVLGTALDEGRVVLDAQPIVSLRTGRVVRHELLARIAAADGHRIAPERFLPEAERSGEVVELDRFVIGEALRIAGSGHPVALNLSATALGTDGLSDVVEAGLRAHDVDPRLVVFEVTETAILESYAVAAAFLADVTARGCGVALDDFGTGYGGFHYLKRLPVGFLKIDREFVCGLESGTTDAHVISSIVGLAQALGLQTVAEGVERLETVATLQALGVDQMQGFALGRPLPTIEAFGEAQA